MTSWFGEQLSLFQVELGDVSNARMIFPREIHSAPEIISRTPPENASPETDPSPPPQTLPHQHQEIDWLTVDPSNSCIEGDEGAYKW